MDTLYLIESSTGFANVENPGAIPARVSRVP
jgi:hypothetical protein